MDKTLNVASVITSDNFENVLQGMRESLIAEKTAEHKAEIKKVKGLAKSDVESIRKEAEERIEVERRDREVAAEAADRVRGELGILNAEDQMAIDALIRHINERIDRKRRRVSRMISGTALLADIAAVFVAYWYPSVTANVLVLLISLLLMGHFSGLLRKLLPLAEVTEDEAHGMMWEEAEARGVSAKLQRTSFSYDGEHVCLVE